MKIPCNSWFSVQLRDTALPMLSYFTEDTEVHECAKRGFGTTLFSARKKI